MCRACSDSVEPILGRLRRIRARCGPSLAKVCRYKPLTGLLRSQVSLEEWSSGAGRERIRSETPDGTPLNLWRATPCGDGWVEGLEGTEDLGAEGDKQAGEGFTALWHGEGEETSAASLGA